MASTEPHAPAILHLSNQDKVLRELISRVGSCGLKVSADHFWMLVEIIVGQQLAVKAADSIRNRLVARLGRAPKTPRPFQRVSDADLRECGLSGAKIRSIRDLCAKVSEGVVPLRGFDELSDEQVTERLVQVCGIGPWSADMFLMFSLGRPDVLPVGDLGFRAGVKDVYGLNLLPSVEVLNKLAEPWRPYRSIATWYFWHRND